MNKAAVVPAHFARHLTDGFDKRLAFDVARRPADFDDDDVRARQLSLLVNRRLDFVGDMGNDLHRLSEVLARALLVEHRPIYLARGEVRELIQILVDKPLVVPQVEVGFRPVLGYEHLAVLIGAHRAGVDVDVGIQLLRRNLVAAHLQQPTERRRRDSLAQTGDDASRYENVLRHICIHSPLRFILRFRASRLRP